MIFNNLFKKCDACRKVKFYVAKRTFFSKALNTEITSENQFCGKCKNGYKNVKKPLLFGKANRNIKIGDDVYDIDLKSN